MHLCVVLQRAIGLSTGYFFYRILNAINLAPSEEILTSFVSTDYEKFGIYD